MCKEKNTWLSVWAFATTNSYSLAECRGLTNLRAAQNYLNSWDEAHERYRTDTPEPPCREGEILLHQRLPEVTFLPADRHSNVKITVRAPNWGSSIIFLLSN
jgi:hypothetical protein